MEGEAWRWRAIRYAHIGVVNGVVVLIGRAGMSGAMVRGRGALILAPLTAPFSWESLLENVCSVWGVSSPGRGQVSVEGESGHTGSVSDFQVVGTQAPLIPVIPLMGCFLSVVFSGNLPYFLWSLWYVGYWKQVTVGRQPRSGPRYPTRKSGLRKNPGLLQ